MEEKKLLSAVVIHLNNRICVQIQVRTMRGTETTNIKKMFTQHNE